MVWLIESWRDCVKRYARRYGLEHECLTHYDSEVADGTPEDEAAFNALYSWDCTDYDSRDGCLYVRRRREWKEDAA
jgi:hypothetical protein